MTKGNGGMSAMKNAYKSRQRTHKERDQPKARKHLGMLEKHKDYKQRALDYQKKREHIKRLEIKARDKNPDSFYFRMVNEQTQDGIHIVDKTSTATAQDEVKSYHKRLLYMKNQLNILNKKINRLQSQLHFINESDLVQRNHVIYVSDDEQVQNFKPTQYFNTTKQMLGRPHNRTKTIDIDLENKEDDCSASLKEKHEKYLKLDRYLEKEVRIKDYIEELQIKLNMSQCEASSTKYTVQEDPITGKKNYRWRFERQK